MNTKIRSIWATPIWKYYVVAFVVALLLWPGAAAVATLSADRERGKVDLSGEWKFLKAEAPTDADFSQWDVVKVPHSWNSLDGQNGKKAEPHFPSGYYRGPGWYAKTFEVPTEWKGKRVFIRFEGVSLVSKVYLNGHLLGEHRGAFAAFAYELTPYIHWSGENVLRVRADNAANPDVLPLAGDFSLQGGIYRPVHLIATSHACITPLDDGSSGVYITPGKVEGGGAEVTVEAKLDNASTSPVGIRVEILDANGKEVASKVSPTEAGGRGIIPVKLTLSVPNPQAWEGRENPYLYSARVTVLGSDRKPFDTVVQNFGFRTFEIEKQGRFTLNGKRYLLKGVNRHQERRDQGWALSNTDHDEDMSLIKEVGSNAIRLAHYQQSDYFLDLCDREGFLVWEEIPLLNKITASPEFLVNAKQQLTEMIKQHYNHPSIFTWGIFNELYHEKSPPVEGLVAELVALARQLDPTRPTSAATNKDKEDLNSLTDVMAFNSYPGWYGGEPKFISANVRSRAKAFGKSTALSEYGAGANPEQHDEVYPPVMRPSKGPFHAEEYQTYCHQIFWHHLKDHPNLWGSFIWAMFDFASDRRNEGSRPGVNDKGLITQDRKIKKDAFFFYKANWNPEPMLHLAARRNTPRRLPVATIEVFTTAPEAEVKVNGKSLGVRKPDDVRVVRWEKVDLQVGENKVEAVATQNGQRLSDECVWVVDPNLPDPTAAFSEPEEQKPVPAGKDPFSEVL